MAPFLAGTWRSGRGGDGCASLRTVPAGRSDPGPAGPTTLLDLTPLNVLGFSGDGPSHTRPASAEIGSGFCSLPAGPVCGLLGSACPQEDAPQGLSTCPPRRRLLVGAERTDWARGVLPSPPNKLTAWEQITCSREPATPSGCGSPAGTEPTPPKPPLLVCMPLISLSAPPAPPLHTGTGQQSCCTNSKCSQVSAALRPCCGGDGRPGTGHRGGACAGLDGAWLGAGDWGEGILAGPSMGSWDQSSSCSSHILRTYCVPAGARGGAVGAGVSKTHRPGWDGGAGGGRQSVRAQWGFSGVHAPGLSGRCESDVTHLSREPETVG